jgi:hypothetical protein
MILVEFPNCSFDLVAVKLFLLQLPPCPDSSCLFGRIRATYALSEAVMSAPFHLL